MKFSRGKSKITLKFSRGKSKITLKFRKINKGGNGTKNIFSRGKNFFAPYGRFWVPAEISDTKKFFFLCYPKPTPKGLWMLLIPTEIDRGVGMEPRSRTAWVWFLHGRLFHKTNPKMIFLTIFMPRNRIFGNFPPCFLGFQNWKFFIYC